MIKKNPFGETERGNYSLFIVNYQLTREARHDTPRFVVR